MPFEIWTPNDIYDLRRDDRNDAIPDYWDRFVSGNHFAETGEVIFADLEEADRFMAPFVLPYEQGKPMQRNENERIEAYRVPYIKLKNAVRPTEVKNLKPSELFRNRGVPLSLEERYDARVAEMDAMHRRAIEMRKRWMRARAVIDAQVRIDYERDQGGSDPSVLLDFGRDPSLSIVKTGDFWNDPDADILGDLETWMNRQYLTYGGGSTSQLIVGAKVAPLFRRNTGIKEMLDTRYRGNDDVQIRQGIMRINQPLSYIGQLTTGLEVWTYKDTFDIPTSNGGKERVDILNENDVVGIAPGASLIDVQGPIYDNAAYESGLVGADIFAKQWQTQDPGETYMMHQASFLSVNRQPNKVFKARVLPVA